MISAAETPFVVYDCSLVVRATGHSVSNLRELLHAVREVGNFVLEHHMMRCQLSDHFELNEFPNDFARWCWQDLGERSTAERLGLIDPYRHENLDSLRAEIAEAVEQRLWTGDANIQSCRAAMDLQLVASQLVAYETGMRLTSVAALAESLPRMSLRSLYYHVHDARRRTGGRSDDFSAWLETLGADSSLIRDLREIDFYFLNLTQLRAAILEVFHRHLPSHQTAGVAEGTSAGGLPS